MDAQSSGNIFLPGTQMTPGQTYVIDSDMDLSALHETLDVPPTATLSVVNGATLTVETIALGNSSILHLDGGHIACDTLSPGQSSSIEGHGSIHSRPGSSATLTTGPGAILDFSDIEVNLGPLGTLTAGAGTTLRMAGRILSAMTLSSLSGTSVIDAPECHVFDVSNLEGRWATESAFAQWFIEPDGDDWAEAINTALTIETEGVYLPGRLCRISKTIKMPVKSRLIGRTRGVTVIDSVNDKGEIEHIDYYGTIIAPTIGAQLTQNVFILLNIRDDFFNNIGNDTYYNDYYKYIREVHEAWPKKDHFPPSGAEVADIRFFGNNIEPASDGGLRFGGQINNLRGIFVAGAAKFKNLVFRSFEQAIAWSRDYADCKHLERCYVQAVNGKSESTAFALDLQNLGDAAIVDGCHIDPTNAKGLRLNLCGGARITNNILNADIEIRGCKGILYSGNHSESGPQLSIINSSVEVSANYFEKGERPSIQIGSTSQSYSSVVTLSNNVYAYMTQAERPSCLYPGTNINVADVSEYDIEVIPPENQSTTLAAININNEMRCYIPTGSYNNLITTGIAICRRIGNSAPAPVKEFNTYSQFLSRDAKLAILWNDANHIQYPPFKYRNIANPQLVDRFVSEGEWINVDGMQIGQYLDYRYQFIYDSDRKIAGNIYKVKNSVSNKDYEPTTVGDSNHVIGFTLRNADLAAGKQIMVRLIRLLGTDKPKEYKCQYVDVPMCVASVLIDVGVSVNGYKWKDCGVLSEAQINLGDYPNTLVISPIHDGIKDVEFHNENVVVWSDSKITDTTGWLRGDIIYNTGPDTSWTQQIIK